MEYSTPEAIRAYCKILLSPRSNIAMSSKIDLNNLILSTLQRVYKQVTPEHLAAWLKYIRIYQHDAFRAGESEEGEAIESLIQLLETIEDLKDTETGS